MSKCIEKSLYTVSCPSECVELSLYDHYRFMSFSSNMYNDMSRSDYFSYS